MTTFSSSPDQLDSTDQTQFETQAWLYDANKPVPVERDPNQSQVPFWKTSQGKIILIAGVFVLVLICVALVVMVIRGRGNGPANPLVDQTPAINMDLGPLGDKVKALTSELKAADPTKELDPFPPVNLEARLDEKDD